MTKEEKAKYYVSCFYPSQQHPTQAMQTAFLDGYRAAEQSSEEMMCKFAEWMDKQMYCLHENCHWYNQEDLDAKLTTQELLTAFKQSLKQ